MPDTETVDSTSQKSFIEVDGRVVGNSQIEQPDAPSSIVGGGKSSTTVRQYITIVPQKNPQRSFVLDVSELPEDFFLPQTNVTLRITKAD